AYAVATALGVQRTHGGTIDEAVTDFLLRRQVLLVLDNCEHVLEAAGALAEAIITRCAEVTVLATSRVRLAVVDEQVWPVPPLPVPGATATSPADVGTSPAAALFIDRAQSIRPDIRLDDSAAAVGSICRDLDGLPLAIELAAARMQALTAPTLASRLSHRVGVLASGHRDDDARYRTLQAVVDWSYDLLDDTERLVFDRLSVFAGGFTLDQATDVCAGGAATSDRIGGVVASLVEKSMVLSPDGLARYRMLESLRQYGAERLTVRGENESVRQAHADTFLTLTEDANTGLQGADEGQWVARLHAELDNIRAAHAWCRRRGEAARALRLSVALHWFASCQVNDEIFSWAAAATELPGAIGDPTLPFVQGSAGVGAGRRGDLQGAVRHAMAGLAASTGPDDPARAVPLEVLADVQRFSGRLDEAVDSYSESVRLARESGDLYSVVYRLVGRALAHAYSGDLDAALASVGEIHRIATATRNPTSTAWTLYALGEVLLDADPDRALGLVEQGLEIARTVDNRFLARVALQSATSLRGRHHEPSTALSSYRDAIEHWYRHGNWTQQWITLRNLIGLLHRVGADEPAAVIYGATTSSTAAPPTIGPEAERLEAVIASLTSGLGPEQFDRAVNEGSALSDDEVVALAVSTIERA
ncbi:MAG: ATP-binding protein, partial [Acidimicrobiia bacterium]